MVEQIWKHTQLTCFIPLHLDKWLTRDITSNSNLFFKHFWEFRGRELDDIGLVDIFGDVQEFT